MNGDLSFKEDECIVQGAGSATRSAGLRADGALTNVFSEVLELCRQRAFRFGPCPSFDAPSPNPKQAGERTAHAISFEFS